MHEGRRVKPHHCVILSAPYVHQDRALGFAGEVMGQGTVIQRLHLHHEVLNPYLGHSDSEGEGRPCWIVMHEDRCKTLAPSPIAPRCMPRMPTPGVRLKSIPSVSRQVFIR